MCMPFFSRKLIFILLLGLFQCQVWAFNHQWPDSINHKSWSSLKTAVQESQLLASDGAADDYFGISVSLSGNRALIGAPYDDNNGIKSGSAYVFELQSGSWVETAKLTANDGAAMDNFGWSVSLSGNRALIGARLDDDHGVNSGSAYVFELQSG